MFNNLIDSIQRSNRVLLVAHVVLPVIFTHFACTVKMVRCKPGLFWGEDCIECSEWDVFAVVLVTAVVGIVGRLATLVGGRVPPPRDDNPPPPPPPGGGPPPPPPPPGGAPPPPPPPHAARAVPPHAAPAAPAPPPLPHAAPEVPAPPPAARNEELLLAIRNHGGRGLRPVRVREVSPAHLEAIEQQRLEQEPQPQPVQEAQQAYMHGMENIRRAAADNDSNNGDNNAVEDHEWAAPVVGDA